MGRSEAAFTAIAVGHGDAFFLKRGGRKALVDGGRSATAFPVQFVRVAGTAELTVLVCTHNDADHSRGVLGFLQAGLDTQEVWLPASWTDRLEDILLSPEDFFRELREDIDRVELQAGQPLASLEQIGERYLEGGRSNSQSQSNGITEMQLGGLNKALENTVDAECSWPSSISAPRLHHWYSNYFSGLSFPCKDERKASLFAEAASAAHMIGEIALAAFHSGALIRWFDVNPACVGGGIPDFLIPVNSKETIRIHRPRRGALQFLALTRANKESLVFASPSNEDCPGILFTSDSDLSFAHPINSSVGMLITAPHHGAESSANAYQRVRRESPADSDFAWVRSDGRFASRPGNSYLSARGRRYCTICRGSAQPKQDVKLISVSQWRPLFTRGCDCR